MISKDTIIINWLVCHMLCNTFTLFSINNSTSRQAASQQVSIIDIVYLLWTIVPNELILVILHMLQWINIVDNVTNTIQKPVVWTRVFIYQFGRHHGGCAVYTTSKSLYGSEICRHAQRCSSSAEFRRRFGRAPSTPVTIRNNFKKYRDKGTSQNLCKQRSGRPRTARSLRNIGAVRRALNCNPDMTARRNTLPNLSKSSFNTITKYELKWHPDGVGNIINNVYSLKHMARMSSLGTIVLNK